jgi:hypothetical protein
MSTRLGMADGRCATINTSGLLLNEGIMTKVLGLNVSDSYEYRMKLQKSDPVDIIPGATCSIDSYKETPPLISGDANNN